MCYIDLKGMAFNSAVFILFFPLAFLAYFYSFKGKQARLWTLFACNLIFYGSWSVSFIPFLLGTGTFDYLVSRYLGPDETGRRGKYAKLLLGLSILLNVGLLAVFKYARLFDPRHVSLVAPLGLSYYTFQSMSYMIDVYRGLYKRHRGLLGFLTSLTFFPHLLAGPIVRFSVLLPQFQSLRRPERSDAARALTLVSVGLAKKTLADLVAPFVNDLFARSSGHGFVESWAAVLGFAAQIYADFSGYTDMALGLALMLGFTLPQNFNLPFLAVSPVDFWRRWHITLSTWFRDYVYFPLALGPLRKHPLVNVFLIALLTGIWHAPRLNALIFGAYHGLLLVCTLALARTGAARLLPQHWLARWLRIAFTFYLVALGQVIFQAPDLAVFKSIFAGMHWLGPPDLNPNSRHLFVLAITALVGGHAVDYLLLQRNICARSPVLGYAAATACFAFAIVLGSQPEFIYFHF